MADSLEALSKCKSAASAQRAVHKADIAEQADTEPVGRAADKEQVVDTAVAGHTEAQDTAPVNIAAAADTAVAVDTAAGIAAVADTAEAVDTVAADTAAPAGIAVVADTAVVVGTAVAADTAGAVDTAVVADTAALGDTEAAAETAQVADTAAVDIGTVPGGNSAAFANSVTLQAVVEHRMQVYRRSARAYFAEVDSDLLTVPVAGTHLPAHRIPLAAWVLPAAAEHRQAAGCLAVDFAGKNFAEEAVEAPLPFVGSPALAVAGRRPLPVSLLVGTCYWQLSWE